MGFVEAVRVCLQDYFKFSGRARRPEYWWFILFMVLADIAIPILDRELFGTEKMLGIEGLFVLFTAIPALAVTWRRLHDVGRPGWICLVPVALLFAGSMVKQGLPAIGQPIIFSSGALGLLILIWTILPSQPGTNQFGPEMPRR
ncbi:MAG: DUF805 domain-containing protein [Pseudomonadota bacterium]